jgi:hypothetical protein
MLSYNSGMKTELEIEIKKIRKQLRIFGLAEDEKNTLRETLEHLKTLLKEKRRNS